MVKVSAGESVAAAIRRRIRRSPNRFWHPSDFAGEPHAVELALSRLVEEGELERVRRGTYWRGTKTRFGTSAPPSIEAVRKVVGESEAIGAAEWYATNLLGLSTQVAPVPVVAVSRRTPTGLPDVRIISRASRTGRRDGHLTPTEVTILEALDGWDRFVEVPPPVALQRFLAAIDQQDVRVDRLVAAARTEPPAVRERLRFVLERGGRVLEASRIERARSRSARDRALAVVEAAD